jgi:tetratricopeptide (TPR) repeat protein
MSVTSLAMAGDTLTAEALFKKGLDAMKHNQFKEACDAFEGSDEADPSPGTEINLALCNEKQGKVASAWGWYRTAAGLADQRNQKDRADLARAEAAKLEPKLHKLTISVKGSTDGLVVTRNGAAVPNALLGTDAPIDPGDYLIEVNAKGKKAWKQTVHIAAGPGIDRLDVPPLEDAPVTATPSPGPATPPGSDYRPAQAGNDGSTQRTVGLIVGGVGILALIGAGGLEIFNLAVTNADYKKIKADSDSCTAANPPGSPVCAGYPGSLQSKDDARHANQTAAIVIAASGGALVITGIVLLATASSSRSTGELTKPRVYPLLGNGTTGLGLSGSF